MTDTQKSGKGAATRGKTRSGFTAEERAAMKDHAEDLQKARRRTGSPEAKAAEDESDVLAKIAEMQDEDRAMAERLHTLIKASAPDLAPRLWYGMPAYAKDGNVVCFFQSAAKFKSRYATLGFSDKANLDEGSMWPVYYALMKLTGTEEARIKKLVKQAAG